MTHTILRAIIAVSVSLSAWAEYSLFVSFAPEPDNGINPVTLALGALGALFVVAQFALAAQAVQRWPEQQHLAAICAATCAVLLVISITGTATWFESAYQQRTTAGAPVTAADQIAQEIAAATLASAAALDAQADRASASNLLTKAAQYRQQAAAMRTAITLPVQPATAPAPVTQATIAGDQLGGLLFWAIAILTDLIPLLAVVLINTTTSTQATAPGAPQPAADSEPVANQEQAEQPTNPETHSPTNPVNQPGTITRDALQTLRAHIRETGTMLTRAQAAELGIGQNQYRRACQQLKDDGVIKQPGPGKPYQVLKRLEAVQ